MSTSLDIIGTNQLGLVTAEHVSDALAEVKGAAEHFPAEERTWLETHDTFWASQIEEYYRSAVARIGQENGEAAVVGMLFSNRILRTMQAAGSLDYDLVRQVRQLNFPYNSGAPVHMEWNPSYPATYDSRPSAEGVFPRGIVEALWKIQYQASRTACVAGLVVSLMDVRGKMPVRLGFNQ